MRTIFGTFSYFWSFFWRPDLQSVFGRLLASILEGLGVICWDIFWICGVTLSMRPRKWKMWFGLIICYESSTWAFADTDGKSHKKVIKYANFGGRFLGRHFGTFLASFWLRFGTILGTKWPKKAIQKSTGKKGPEKVMQVFAGVCEPWGCCPLKTIQLDSWGII